MTQVPSRAVHRIALLLVALAAACGRTVGPTGPATPPGPDPDVLPPIEREFRGIWTATVANIDWPSRAGLTADQQRTELGSILDRARAAGMNAVVLHVRPAGDALYRSELEPWGRMLTGTQGVDPGYDPLEFAVAEAHRRGLELHAWINPFRAGNAADTLALASTHIFRTRRDLVRVYGAQIWMDPGEPEVHDHSMRVARDIVRRYDIDALHLDDYFYPYPASANGSPIPFPDSSAFARFGGGVALADWRRANVDRFVERLYREVHEEKPWVRVGISPFGIWRPGVPAGITGFDAYASLYADARKWLVNGWVDYLAPQLYWGIEPPQQSFTTLLSWWLEQNVKSRFVWPGIATYRLYEGTTRYTTDEVVNQVAATRARAAGGVLFYNTTTTLTRNGGEVASALRTRVFPTVALSPAATWLDATAPATPVLSAVSAPQGSWTATATAAGEPIRFWHIRFRAGRAWTAVVLDGSSTSLRVTAPSGGAIDWVVVNAVDRVGNVSPDAVWRAAP